jgi:hypothetical protein
VIRISHVEVSVPRGTLTDGFVADLDRLTEIFEWPGTTRIVRHPELGPSNERAYRISPDLALVVREQDRGLDPGVEDHVGFTVDDVTLDRFAGACSRLAAADPRLELKYLVDGKPLAFDARDQAHRTFFVRYLLPIWFQFESIKPKQTQG